MYLETNKKNNKEQGTKRKGRAKERESEKEEGEKKNKGVSEGKCERCGVKNQNLKQPLKTRKRRGEG